MKGKIIVAIILISVIFPVFIIGQESSNLPDPGLTPDSPFYFFDTAWEKISLFFTFSSEKKAEKSFQFAEEKLAEVRVMIEKNKTKALAEANQGYQGFLDLANQKTKEAKEKGKDVEELAILITEKTLKHQEVLIEVFEQVPEEAKSAIVEAIQTSRKGSEEAVQVVDGAKKSELLQKIEETRIKVEEKVTALEARVISLEEILEGKVIEAEAEAKRLREEAETAKEETEKARLIAEAEKAKTEAEKARAETEKARAETERLRKEAEEAKKLLEEAKKEETQGSEEEPVPLSITSVTPNQILNNIDNYLTIRGTGIKLGAEVRIGHISFGTGNVIDDKIITIRVSSGVLATNVFNVQVINLNGETDILYNALTVVAPPAPTSPASTELTPEEITARISPALVQIRNDIPGFAGTGSGVIIDSAGYILTNEHVIKGEPVYIDVLLNDGTITSASIIGWNEIYDLAVIKLTGSGFDYAALGDSNAVSLGEDVFAFGYPLTQFTGNLTVLDGIIANTNIDINGVDYIQITASIQSGNSGGPLVNKNAEVIGINTLCRLMQFGVCPPGWGHAVKINEAKSILSDLKAGAKVSIFPSEPEPEPEPEPESEPGPTDTAPPTISNIETTNIGLTSATITWTTDEPGTSQIEYGATESLGLFSSLNSELLASHAVALSDLNLETTYYYKVISKDGAGNQSASFIQTFSTKSSGYLSINTVSSNSETVRLKLGENLMGITFTDVKLEANIENIKISEIIIKRINGADTNFSKVSLWDGSVKIAENTLSDGLTTFNFGVTISKDSSKILTIKADLNSIDSGSVIGDNPRLCVVANGITAQGISSGIIPSIYGIDSDYCGKEIIFTQLKPTLAAASLPSTVYSAGEKVLYRWTVTAYEEGDIGWAKIIFDMSGNITWHSEACSIGMGGSASDDDIYIGTSTNPGTQLIAASSMTVYNVATGERVHGNASVQNLATGGARIAFIPNSEQVIAAGITKTYELRGTILVSGSAGDAILTKIAARSTGIITDTYANVADTAATLVWTDRSADNHSELTSDWFNDYQVPGLSTATLCLSK